MTVDLPPGIGFTKEGHDILAAWLSGNIVGAIEMLHELSVGYGEPGMTEFLLLCGHLACEFEVVVFKIWLVGPPTQMPEESTREVVLATADAFAPLVCAGHYDMARAVLQPLFHAQEWGTAFTVTLVRSIVDNRPGELRNYLAEQGREVM